MDMSADTSDLINAILRTNLPAFIEKAFRTINPSIKYVDNWHIEAIAAQLDRVRSGEVKRLLINQPPRSLKSIATSVAYVAWLLGRDPSQRIVVVCYSQELGQELHRQFRMVVQSEWYQELFPETAWEKDTGTEMVTTVGGSRLTTSIGGTLTGRGADLIIIDDPMKADEASSEPARRKVVEFYTGTLVSRLNDKAKGAIVVVMQRLHEDDLAGHLIDQGGWQHLNLPAIATRDEALLISDGRMYLRKVGEVLHPERENRQMLDVQKADMGSLNYSAQYQQDPIPVEGNLIKREWLRSYDEVPKLGGYFLSWDVAGTTNEKRDYSVCTVWKVDGPNYYLIDVWRDRVEYPDLRRAVAQLAEKYRPATIIIEETGLGLSLVKDLQRDPPRGMDRPVGFKPEGSKDQRVAAESAKFETGSVYLPKDASWLPDLEKELLGFPHTRHDDQVDSITQFLCWYSAHRSSYEHAPIVSGFIAIHGDSFDDEKEASWSWGY